MRKTTLTEILARFDPEKHRHKLMLDDAPVGTETGGEEPCLRCKRVILAGGCPYGDDECPQFTELGKG